MSIQLKNSVTCKDVHSETNRLGESVELRYFDGRLYVYNVGTGNLVGLTGADLAVDALPSSFHLEKMGTGGSLEVQIITSELTFLGIDASDFNDEVSVEFSESILSTLSFDAIINIISVSSGSAIILYEVVPSADTSAESLASAVATLSDADAITTAVANSATLSSATPQVTVAPATTTSTVNSTIISAALTLPTGWSDDYVYDFVGTGYADMNNQWWRMDSIKSWNLAGDALYIASNYNNTFYIVKLENGAHEVVKQLTSADINTTHPNYDQPQNWSNSKCWVVNNKIYAWTGYTRFGLIVFDNLTSGDNTHTVPHTNPTDWQGTGPFAVSTDAIWYTSTKKSLDLKKKLLTDLTTEISVCTFPTAREIFKIDVDLDGNVYVLCVDDWNDTTGYFYKIPAGTSVPELIVPGGVATLQVPAHNYSQFSGSYSNYGGIDIWYDNGAIYFIDNSSGTYVHDPDYDYATGDIFHIRKVDIAAQEASTVLALTRSEYYQTSDGSTGSNTAMWYFKDNTFHAFSPWTGTVMTKKHISTLTSPYISAKSVGPLSHFKVQLDDGTPHQIASVTTSNVSKAFVPARPFYSLKINMWNSDNENINEWTIKVPEIAKLNSVIAGTMPSPETLWIDHSYPKITDHLSEDQACFTQYNGFDKHAPDHHAQFVHNNYVYMEFGLTNSCDVSEINTGNFATFRTAGGYQNWPTKFAWFRKPCNSTASDEVEFLRAYDTDFQELTDNRFLSGASLDANFQGYNNVHSFSVAASQYSKDISRDDISYNIASHACVCGDYIFRSFNCEAGANLIIVRAPLAADGSIGDFELFDCFYNGAEPINALPYMWNPGAGSGFANHMKANVMQCCLASCQGFLFVLVINCPYNSAEYATIQGNPISRVYRYDPATYVRNPDVYAREGSGDGSIVGGFSTRKVWIKNVVYLGNQMLFERISAFRAGSTHLYVAVNCFEHKGGGGNSVTDNFQDFSAILPGGGEIFNHHSGGNTGIGADGVTNARLYKIDPINHVDNTASGGSPQPLYAATTQNVGISYLAQEAPFYFFDTKLFKNLAASTGTIINGNPDALFDQGIAHKLSSNCLDPITDCLYWTVNSEFEHYDIAPSLKKLDLTQTPPVESLVCDLGFVKQMSKFGWLRFATDDETETGTLLDHTADSYLHSRHYMEGTMIGAPIYTKTHLESLLPHDPSSLDYFDLGFVASKMTPQHSTTGYGYNVLSNKGTMRFGDYPWYSDYTIHSMAVHGGALYYQIYLDGKPQERSGYRMEKIFPGFDAANPFGPLGSLATLDRDGTTALNNTGSWSTGGRGTNSAGTAYSDGRYRSINLTRKLPLAAATTIDATKNHPDAVLQYTTDSPATAASNWVDYPAEGFIPSSESYTVSTRVKMGYTDDLGEDREHYSAGPYKSKTV